MRIVRVHCPGSDPALAASIGAAVRAFNAGLDIRLRFLSIGLEESVLELADASGAAEAMGAALAPPPPDLVVLAGGGEPAVAAASTALRARIPLVRIGAGDRNGEGAGACRAVDRLCAVLLPADEAAAAVLRAEGLDATEPPVGADGDPETGERIVRALSRMRRRMPC